MPKEASTSDGLSNAPGESQVFSLPLSTEEPKPISSPPPVGHRFVVVLGVVSVIALLAINGLRRVEYSGDEGFYGVTAQNMLRSPGYILRPSYSPAGDFGADKDGFAHPPFNSYFYAASLWLTRGSLIGPELVNAAAFASLLFFSSQLLRRFDERVAIFATLLMAASPPLIYYYSQLEAEPLMTTSGIAALFFALRGDWSARSGGNFFWSGLFLGLAFAFKLWLCGPLALAVITALCARGWQSKASPDQMFAAAGLFSVGAILPAGTHLLAIAIIYPADLGFWLKNIYFGVFTSAGISGSKLDATGVSSDWIHPFWYYGAALYRDLYFLVPIILLGIGSAVRDGKLNRNLLWITLAGLAGVLPLSIIKVKEPLYVLSCSIFLYFLAGICGAALVRRIAARKDLDRFSTVIAPLAILGALVMIPLAHAKGIQGGKITTGFVAAHSVVFAASLVIFVWSRRASDDRIFARVLCGACGLVLVFGGAYHFLAQRPRDRAISNLIQPDVKDNSPASLSFIASNYKCYQFFSFRHGCYWHELALDQNPDTLLGTPEFQKVRAFIIDPNDERDPRLRPWLQWLEKNSIEKTAELNAHLRQVSGFRVFLRK